MKKKELIFEYKGNYYYDNMLVNNNVNKSIFLQDIGVNSKNFNIIIISSTILALVMIFSLYLLFKI